MPKFCAVYGCTNRSNREKNKGYFRVPKVVIHKGEKFKKVTEKRRQAWIRNLRLRSGGAESDNARICSDHFVKGCPSAANDVDSPDWAPTVNLGYQQGKPMTEASCQREERLRSRKADETCTDAAEALLDLGEGSQSPASEYHKDAGCQTDLTMEDLEKMEDVLNHSVVELSDLRKKVLDREFSPDAFQNNEEDFDLCLVLDDDSNGQGGEASKSPQESRRLSIQRCIQSLVHACQCRNANCALPSCQKMKRVAQHTKGCKRKTNCPVCKQLIALCCYHAKRCQENRCPVPFCLNIKHKLRQQQAHNQLPRRG